MPQYDPNEMGKNTILNSQGNTTMARLILSTTGTSLATNIVNKLNLDKSEKDALRTILFQNSNWDTDINTLESTIKDYLKKNPASYEDTENRKKLSAELKSLEYLKINNQDELALIATDTAPSRFICELLKSLLVKIYSIKENQIQILRIKGLQTHNAKIMRNQGLKNLIGEVQNIIKDNSYREIICNVTGGFKGVVPFITILSMLYKAKTVYVFESSEELIVLPPLPFSFDLDLFEKVKPALQYIEQEIAVAEEAYLNKIAYYTDEQRELYLSFVEPIDDYKVTLSPLAYSLLDIDNNAPASKVAQSVLKQLKKMNEGDKKAAIKNILSQSRNPLWRAQKYHSFSGTDLLVLKPGSTAERIAGFVENGIFHVCLVFADHDKYEKELSRYKKNDFDTEQFQDWEGQTA